MAATAIGHDMRHFCPLQTLSLSTKMQQTLVLSSLLKVCFFCVVFGVPILFL